MISIIIPIYKVEKVLRRCLDSVLSQTYTDFEVLIVDDGSPDNCWAICNEYAKLDNRIKALHKKNGGLPSARNFALDHMSYNSEFICFIDSDDYVEPTWLQDYIDNYNGEDVLFQNARWWRDKEIILNRNVELKCNCTLFAKIETLALKNTQHVWSAMWKADIIRRNNLRFPNYKYWEDVAFCFSYYYYAKNIGIISNHKLHCYNYNYFFPTSHRKYNDITIEWFLVKTSVINEWWNLCLFYGEKNSFMNYGNGLIQDLYSKLLVAYKSGAFSNFDKSILLDCIYKLQIPICLPWKPIKLKLVNLCIIKNKRITYRLLKILANII